MTTDTKPGAAGLTLEEVLADHESLWGSDDYTHCVCGAQTTNLGGLLAHVAAEVSRWLRAVLLGDEVVEAAGEGVEDGLSDPHSGRRDIARAALTAALDRVEALSTEEAGA